METLNTNLKTTHLQITGMSCAVCATRIEKGLNQLDGVSQANVNFTREQATLTYNAQQLDAAAIDAAIKTLGYDVVTAEADFALTGMSCAVCAARIENGLQQLEGVTQATVNFTREQAHLVFHPANVSVAQLLTTVETLGFQAHHLQADEPTEDYRAKERQAQTRQLLLAAVLTLPLLWTMVAHFSFTAFIYVPPLFMNPWFQLLLATPVQFLIGRRFYIGAYKALRHGSANMDVLVALGTSAAYFYSLYQTLQASSHSHVPQLYFETSALLITFVLLGKLIETKAKGRSADAIKKLIELQPATALVIRDGQEQEVPLAAVLLNDVLAIKPGAKIPVDGEVVNGSTLVDEALLTGESLPVTKKSGDPVYGATLNKNGFITIRATKIGGDTALGQIIKVVEDAQASKAPIQRLADRIAAVFVPLVVSFAFISALCWLLWLAPGEFTTAFEVFIAVLVIACPCALGLATPTSIMAGSGRAAEYGVLFKGGEHLEQTGKIDTVVVDKTGTLTHGKPVLTDVILASEQTRASFLTLVATAEKQSEHPLAQAIVNAVVAEKIAFDTVQTFEAIPGYGVQATVANQTVSIGTRALMHQNGIDTAAVEATIARLEQEGKTTMIVGIDGRYAGLVAVADTLKETSARAVSTLQKRGITVIMMTGDNARTAAAIGEKVGVDTVIAEVLPSAKAQAIKQLQQAGKIVAMVGDGINDAPALATAHIGMAIGTGTDVAIAAADITLIRGDLNGIVDAIVISRKTMRNIKQNLFWAFAYNTLGITIAAAGLLAPWVAGAAMAFSSVSVVLNALRLQRVKLND